MIFKTLNVIIPLSSTAQTGVCHIVLGKFVIEFLNIEKKEEHSQEPSQNLHHSCKSYSKVLAMISISQQ